MIRWSAIFIAIAASHWLTACKSLDFDFGWSLRAQSELVPIAPDPAPFLWRQTSDQEYFEILFKGTPLAGEITRSHALSTDHDMVRRVEFWLDAFHSHISSEPGSEKIPKPRVKLIRSPQVNAMVARGLVCLNMQATFAGDASATTDGDLLTFSRREQEFSLLETKQRCLPSKLSPEKEKELIAWQVSAYPECRPQFEKDRVVFPSACASLKGRKQKLRAPRLAFKVVPDQITVYTGLLQRMTEEQTVAILAHELVHYYRAHALTPEKYHQIFYRLGASQIGRRPSEHPEARSIGEPMLKALDYGFDQYFAVKNQRYHSILADIFLFKMADVYPKMLCSGPKPSPGCAPCTAFRSSAKDAVAKKTFEGFPRDPLPENRVSAYAKLENLAAACFRHVPMSDLENPIAEISRPGLKKLVAAFSESLAADLLELPSRPHLDATLLNMTLQFWQRELLVIQELRTLTEEANRFGLGYYTTEQEADELALEWTHALGLRPQAGVEAVLALSRAKTSPAEIRRAESCEFLYQNQWRDKAGRLVMVPIGSLRNAHHDNCFRAFNMDREIKAHRLHLSARKLRPQPSGRAWADLQRSLAEPRFNVRATARKRETHPSPALTETFSGTAAQSP